MHYEIRLKVERVFKILSYKTCATSVQKPHFWALHETYNVQLISSSFQTNSSVTTILSTVAALQGILNA